MRDATTTTGFWRIRPFERPIAFHPLLASLPILLAYTYDNRNMAAPWAFLPAYLFTVVVTLGLWAFIGAIARNPRVGAMVATPLVLGFYAHHDAGEWSSFVWAAIAIFVVVILAWRPKAAIQTTFFNLFAVLGVLPGAWALFDFHYCEPHRPEVAAGYLDALAIHPHPPEHPPDVWYIALDGYGRADVLRDLYDYEDPLGPELEKRGFYVADEAHSNYAQTALSFSSALNLDYVPTLLSDLDANRESKWRNPLSELIATNRVVAAFDRAGYRIIEYPGEYSDTHLADSDEVRRPFFTFTEFEYVLVGKTAVLDVSRMLGFAQSRLSHEIRRRHIDWVLDDLERGDRWEGPTFVFAHIVAPHPPFVFRPNGDYRPSLHTAAFADGNGWRLRAEKYGEKYEMGYRDQAAYLKNRLLTIIDNIKATSEVPPVIVIAADHGPGAHLDWASQSESDMRERMSILLAAYLPAGEDALYPAITPINMWRVVLNEVLDARLPRLPDKSFFQLWALPYTFYDVTNEVNGLTRPPRPKALTKPDPKRPPD